MSPVAVGAEEKRVTRCRVGLWDSQESRGAEKRRMLEDEEPGGQSEGGGKENGRGVQLGVVVCAGTEKGRPGAGVGWNTGRIGREVRRGEASREGEGRGRGKPGTRILPKHRAIPGAALNESAFLCPAMLSKCKQRPIIYHPLRKQLSPPLPSPVPPLYTCNPLEGRHAVSVTVDVVR